MFNEIFSIDQKTSLSVDKDVFYIKNKAIYINKGVKHPFLRTGND